MIFQVDWNKIGYSNDEVLKQLGCKAVHHDEIGDIWELEVPTLEDLLKIEEKIHKITGKYYTVVLSNDPPAIYIDEGYFGYAKEEDLLKFYKEWCKSSGRGGTILTGSSVTEFIQYCLKHYQIKGKTKITTL